jgi:hypothetical protein
MLTKELAFTENQRSMVLHSAPLHVLVYSSALSFTSFQASTAISIENSYNSSVRITVFWNVRPCSLVDMYTNILGEMLPISSTQKSI